MTLTTTADGTTRRLLHRLALPVYLPWLAAGLGLGMLVPVLPLYLESEDLSFRAIAVVLAASGVGAAFAGMPVTSLALRVGERGLAVLALMVMAGASVLVGFTTAVVALTVLQAAAGAGSIALRLSAQSVVTRSVVTLQRGRAMAMMGGTVRLAFFIGPLVGGWLADQVGFRATFIVVGAVTAVGLLPMTLSGTHATDAGMDAMRLARSDRVPLRRVIARHRRLLARAGIGSAVVMTVRSGRLVVLPLVGSSLGLSTTAVGALVAVGTAADLLLFPVSGYVMDRFGRLAAMVPAFGLLGLGLLLLGVADSTTTVVVAGVIMGVGNGLSSGSLLTMSSDLAPRDDVAGFLGALASLQDMGKVAGPLVVGWSADAIGLGASAIVLAMAMFAGLAWIVVVIGETSDRGSYRFANRSTHA